MKGLFKKYADKRDEQIAKAMNAAKQKAKNLRDKLRNKKQITH